MSSSQHTNANPDPPPTEPRETTATSRRSLLTMLMAGGGLVGASILAIPGILAVLTPAWRGRWREPWRPVGPLDDFAVGTVHKAVVSLARGDWARSLDEIAVYVWRPSEQEVVVYSRNCTDLSCPVNFDPGSACFFCPCHGGIFDIEGDPLAGPPKRPLYRYDLRLNDGVIEIDLNSVPAMA